MTDIKKGDNVIVVDSRDTDHPQSMKGFWGKVTAVFDDAVFVQMDGFEASYKPAQLAVTN